MPKGDVLKAALAARIKNSGVLLTVHYPPVREGVTGTAPLSRPLNPLGSPETLSTTPADPEASQQPVEMPCLWLDAYSLAMGSRRTTNAFGMVEGAVAMARVLATDCLKDPDDPSQGTVFDGCEVVECGGRRYRVLATEPISASFYAPHSYAVWLGGAVLQ